MMMLIIRSFDPLIIWGVQGGEAPRIKTGGFVKKTWFLMFFVLFALSGSLSAQQAKIRQMSLKEFPKITAVVAVENSMGGPVPVKFEQMKVFEEGKPVIDLKVAAQEGAGAPFWTVIVLDKSGSMRGVPMDEAKKGARQFVNMMKGEDRCAYIAFDTQVEVQSPFSQDRGDLDKKVAATAVGSDTALLDALFKATELCVEVPGHALRIVLALTDGRENKSQHKLEEVLAAAREKRVSIYTIGLGKEIDSAMLTRLAGQTEANYYPVTRPEDLTGIYARISKLLHAQYQVAFTSPFSMDDKWHKLRVEIPYMGRTISGEREYLSAKESKIAADLLKDPGQDEKAKQAAAEARALQEREQQAKGRKARENRLVLGLGAVFGVLLVVLLTVIIVRRRKK